MDHAEPESEHLPGFHQVPDIRAGIAPARRAGTVLVDGAHIPFEAVVLQIDPSLAGKEMPVPRVPGGKHAVEHVDPAHHTVHDIGRRPHAHQIARLVLRHMLGQNVEDRIHLLRALPYGQTADGVAGQIQFRDPLHVFDAEIGISPALIDTEQHLSGIRSALVLHQFPVGIHAPHQPVGCPLHGGLDVGAFRRIADAFVERHRDIRPEIRLDPHAVFRPHEDLPAVHMRLEMHPVVADVFRRRQGEDLKPAAVREDRPVPVHKAVQPAAGLDHLVSRSDRKMIGIGELHLAADLFQIGRGQSALDGGLCADVHEKRRPDGAVRRMQQAEPRVSSFPDKFKIRHSAPPG